MKKTNLPDELEGWKNFAKKLLIHTESEILDIFIGGITLSIGASMLTSILMHSTNYWYSIPSILLIILALSVIWYSVTIRNFVKSYEEPENKSAKFDLDYDTYGRKLITGFISVISLFILATVALIIIFFLVHKKANTGHVDEDILEISTNELSETVLLVPISPVIESKIKIISDNENDSTDKSHEIVKKYFIIDSKTPQ